ncbi:MAG: LacI family DNA-binding transcriptional regulator [Burkholderiales bacterium]
MKEAAGSGIVTIREVAAAAGVHVSTVSRALDPAKRSLISAEVLRSVERAAERLGYRANRAASALRTGRTRTIGVLVPDITNAVFPPILGGIEASASARGYFVFLANVPDPALAKDVVERMLAQQVAGVISAIAMRDDPLTALLLRDNVAAVLVNRADESGRLSAVVSDDRLAMKLAVDHLVALGHRRIAHLAGPQNVPTGLARCQGFEQALRDHALAPLGVIECDRYSREAGRTAMQHLLAESAGATAVVCCNDLVALGAYDALRAAGLRIPQDISITGHNDMPLVDMIEPPLTTIRLPHRELGWRAAEMLLEWIEKPATQARIPSTVVLRPELVVRGSTGVAAAAP